MKRIAFSLLSAALLSVAVVPMAQAVPFNNPHQAGIRPRILTSDQAMTGAGMNYRQPRQEPALEQARLNRLDRTGNTNGSLNAYQQKPVNDLDPHNIASVSPLQQMRLARLNNSN